MALEAWYSLAVVGMIIAVLIGTRWPADVVMLAGLTLLMAGGVLTAEEALAGFSNEGMITVGVLYVVVTGFRETGGIAWIASRVLGRPRSVRAAQVRMMAPVTMVSAFLNNTPVVAMMIPAVNEWAKKHNVSPSKLMIPLSYAAILGGTCSLIGTSTNLVVNGLMISAAEVPAMGMFDIAWVGLPCALIGTLYVLYIGSRLLPERRPAIGTHDDPRQYTVEMVVEPGSPLAGKTIEENGLRNLPGMYLIEIDRDERIIPAVSPRERLLENDRLVFAGVVESVVDLQKIRGLTPATNQVFKLDSPRRQRCLIETVVSNSCPLIGKTIKEGRFRSRYNAVVIAVARNGERIKRKIGEIVLRPGDTLLLETHPSFFEMQRNSSDFYLVSRVENSNPPRHEQALVSMLILGGMVVSVTLGWLPMLLAAMLAAGLMLAARCCSVAAARRSVDWQVLLVIGAAFGLGEALSKTGAADAIAGHLISLSGGGPWLTLLAVYLVTMLFTELITNNAAAVLVFPLALSASQTLGVDFMPFAVCIMMAASACFSTPIGYQTNLMVYGPGNYRFTDYLRVGIPLNMLMAAVTVSLAPLIWPF